MNPYAQDAFAARRSDNFAFAAGKAYGGIVGSRGDFVARTVSERTVISSHTIAIIKRLESCLDEEAGALASNSMADLTAFIARKSQGLVEFNRIVASLGDAKDDVRLGAAVSGLREKIDRNMGILRMHLGAVAEISDLLTDAIRSAESDGTYSPTIRGLK